MTEFDEMMNSLIKDEKEVPPELNLKLKRKIRTKYRYNKLIKSIPMSAVACVAVGIFLVSAIGQNDELINVPEKNVNEIIISEKIVSKPQPVVQEKGKSEAKIVKKEIKESVDEINNGEIAVAQIEPNEGISVAEVEIIDEILEGYVGEEENETHTEEIAVYSQQKLLIDYLENDQEKILLVSGKIKEQMTADEEIDYYDSFESIVGDEEYYLTDENELVIVFEEGELAPEEHGKIYFNVGIV